MPSRLTSVDIIVPVFNEETVIEEFHRRLERVVPDGAVRTRFIYVNDGSDDGTSAKLKRLQEADPRVVILTLSRNFGHQAALTAGIDHADADAVIMMDGDGQHPPELIPRMLERFAGGCSIVLTQRVEEQDAGMLKRLSTSAFYSLINRIGQTRILAGAADFRLLSRDVVEALRSMPEYHRFLRGLVAWLGFCPVIIPYSPPPRIAGRTKYSFGKMLALAGDAIFSFSLLPLRLGIMVGMLLFVLAAAEVIYVALFWIRGQQHLLVPGWSSLMFVLLAVGGFIMCLLGFIGVYVGYIFQEVKRRPVYVLDRTESDARAARGPAGR